MGYYAYFHTNLKPKANWQQIQKRICAYRYQFKHSFSYPMAVSLTVIKIIILHHESSIPTPRK